ncbi:LysR family transcriptional regulator [Pelagibius litoralis]|uniref:LysR family transcriptional regulator n=1 Tax=Pelagibius litoralis TaxID=374515 RepID=A0A967EZP9_9PROT|nr:LysR family transcriptional regulator [Pelagibius litoralis]NIA70371.1 LysR family transcriptional regulator [Pelagibius litoralis]
MNSLRAFEAAARHSSFAKAASELNVSHSVVSQHVKKLELWFGTELFMRLGNRVELSGDGRALLPQVASGLQTLRDGCNSLLRKTQSGTLVVSAEPALASLWLRKRATEFCKLFPRIEIDLRPAWTPDRLGDENADMLIHFETRMPSSGVERQGLFPIDGYPACTPKFRDKLLSDDLRIDWDSVPLVHDNGREIWHKWYAAYQPESSGWQQGRVYSDLSLAIDAAVDGEGIVLADDILCQREIESGALVRLDPQAVRCVWYQIALPKGGLKAPVSETLKQWLLDQALPHRNN